MEKLMAMRNARKQLEKQLKENLYKMEKWNGVDVVLYNEYSMKVDQTLDRIEKYNKTVTKRDRLDPNTIFRTVGSIAGIALVLDFERGGGICSKAFTLIDKIKI